MATLVLGTIGRAVGGRVGGLLGAFVGAALDRTLLGGNGAREGAHLASLAVQSSAYGEPIPRCYGRMRVAGNLIWSAGITETRSRSGSQKRGTASTGYSYSASFAVLLTSRPIVEIGRIWGDGKLLRAEDGTFISPATIRVYPGSEDQPVDPLIAAAEGDRQAPAYRGRAYVVFEDLALADYGNRIPNLTFEVIADDGDRLALDLVARDIGIAAGALLTTTGSWPSVDGFVAISDTARDALARLDDMAGMSVIAEDDGLRLQVGAPITRIPIDEDDLGATSGERVARRSDTRAPAATVADAVSVTFSDPSRDYQSGQQRATRRTPPLRIEQRSFDAALSANDAKSLASNILRRMHAARTGASVILPWRYAGIVPGDLILNGDDEEPWRVRTTTLVGAVVELGVERVAHPSPVSSLADPGRVFDPHDEAPGETVLHVLDLPSLPGTLLATPRLLLAGGSRGRWARPTVVVSGDGGASYVSELTLDMPATIGVADTVLPSGSMDRWDRASILDISLLDEDAWLESMSEAAVLAGANMAAVGDELIQFADVLPLGAGRFRLTTLLRGRRGTEGAAGRHAAGERFVLLDGNVGVFEPSVEAVGTTMIFKALSPGQDSATATPTSCVVAASSLRPLAPVFLTATIGEDGLDVTWLRRSRAGFGWVDGIDAPLGEANEAYRVDVEIDRRPVRSITVGTSAWRYENSWLVSDGVTRGAAMTIRVAQISPTVGLGLAATIVATL